MSAPPRLLTGVPDPAPLDAAFPWWPIGVVALAAVVLAFAWRARRPRRTDPRAAAYSALARRLGVTAPERRALARAAQHAGTPHPVAALLTRDALAALRDACADAPTVDALDALRRRLFGARA